MSLIVVVNINFHRSLFLSLFSNVMVIYVLFPKFMHITDEDNIKFVGT